MSYFKLNVFCKYIYGKNAGCIYNMNSHEMISVPNPLNEILNKAQMNKEILEQEKEILKELVAKKLGNFYQKPNYAESLHFGINPAIKEMIPPNSYVRRCYIQLTNECNLNCSFCDEDDIVNRRTGCKKWNNIDRKISLEEWKLIVTQLRNLGCDELIFIGGNPFLEYDKMVKIVMFAKNIGMSNFTVYSHEMNVNDSIIAFLSEYKFNFVGTIISLDNDTYKRISGDKKSINTILEDIGRLKKYGVNFYGNLIVGNFNESEIQNITKKFIANNITLKYNLIYNKPENSYYSELFINKMYNKVEDFGIVTKESVSFLSEYNSCLYGQLYINISGNITPCPMMNRYIIGNVRDEGGIADVINCAEYQKIITMSREKIADCKDCAYKLNCFDCRAIENTATGFIDGQEYCKFCKEGDLVG